jgi:hypothetical protein
MQYSHSMIFIPYRGEQSYFKNNGDEALSDELLFKGNGDEA